MSKILITGAGGFIGSHLVDYLLTQNVKPNDLRLFLYKNESLVNLPKRDFDIFRGDIRSETDVRKACKDIDVVYHLAALTVSSKYTEKDYFSVNTDGTRALLKSAKANNVKKFIFFSSVAVYGLPFLRGDMKNISESSHYAPSEVYGESKLKAENLVIGSGLNYSIIRPTTVYGPRDHGSFPKFIKLVKSHLFFIVGDGENKLDYVFVRDLVRAARLAEKSRYKNSNYIIGGGPQTLNSITKSLLKSTNSWIIPFRIPKSIALLISLVTGSLGLPFYPARVKAMTSFFYFNLSKARLELNYYPDVKMKEGVDLVLKSLT